VNVNNAIRSLCLSGFFCVVVLSNSRMAFQLQHTILFQGLNFVAISGFFTVVR
jgi:hypothetical protein